jgi:hypothetical protein
MACADEVVSDITFHFCLLTKRHCNENLAVRGGYGCHGQTHGVQTWVVGCAFENLLGVEIPFKDALPLCKKTILYSILHTRNTPTLRSNTPPKMGY